MVSSIKQLPKQKQNNLLTFHTTSKRFTPLPRARTLNISRSLNFEPFGTHHLRLGIVKGAIRCENLSTLVILRQRLALDRFTLWWRAIPSFINVTGEHCSTYHFIAFITFVDYRTQIADGAVDKVVVAMRN